LFDFAAALNVTGDESVLPGVGAQMVTPIVEALHEPGVGVGVGDGVELVPNMSFISMALAAAPGYVVSPTASMTVRSRF
jgi:hypothetical protein